MGYEGCRWKQTHIETLGTLTETDVQRKTKHRRIDTYVRDSRLYDKNC